jgi:hypothetical protein
MGLHTDIIEINIGYCWYNGCYWNMLSSKSKHAIIGEIIEVFQKYTGILANCPARGFTNNVIPGFLVVYPVTKQYIGKEGKDD